ncbi:MAG: PsbP-related protein, partial [Patescibacteria group bacterium]
VKKSESITRHQTTNPIKTSTSSPENEIGNWKIYRNDQYGFEFQYPSSWTMDDQSKNYLGGFYIELSPPNPKPMTGYLTVQIDTRTDLNQIRNLYLDGGYAEKVVNLGGKKTYAYTRDNTTIYYIQLNGKILLVDAHEKTTESDQITSTFKFKN